MKANNKKKSNAHIMSSMYSLREKSLKVKVIYKSNKHEIKKKFVKIEIFSVFYLGRTANIFNYIRMRLIVVELNSNQENEIKYFECWSITDILM